VGGIGIDLKLRDLPVRAAIPTDIVPIIACLPRFRALAIDTYLPCQAFPTTSSTPVISTFHTIALRLTVRTLPVYTRLLFAIRLRGNTTTHIVADLGDILLAKCLSRSANPGQTFACLTVVFYRASLGDELHAIVGASGCGHVVNAEYLVRRALRIDAATIEAMLVFLSTIFFVLDGRALAVADLIDLTVAGHRARLAYPGMAGAILTVVPNYKRPECLTFRPRNRPLP